MNRSGTSQKTNSTTNIQGSGNSSIKNQFKWMNKYPVFIFSIIVIMGLTTCKKDDNPEPEVNICDTSFFIALQDEISDLHNAIGVWANDPTLANCNAYKAAYQVYIDALEPYGNCPMVGTSRAEWEEAIELARNDLASINCEEEK